MSPMSFMSFFLVFQSYFCIFITIGTSCHEIEIPSLKYLNHGTYCADSEYKVIQVSNVTKLNITKLIINCVIPRAENSEFSFKEI